MVLWYDLLLAESIEDPHQDFHVGIVQDTFFEKSPCDLLEIRRAHGDARTSMLDSNQSHSDQSSVLQ